jgi:hypothetical protein
LCLCRFGMSANSALSPVQALFPPLTHNFALFLHAHFA